MNYDSDEGRREGEGKHTYVTVVRWLEWAAAYDET